MSDTIKQLEIHVGMIDFNEWNPNKMSQTILEAEEESIREFGFIDPPTVRLKDDGRYQVIDGEHRIKTFLKIRDDWKAGIPVEGKLVDQIESGNLPCSVIDVSDNQAKRLTVILNETRGQADHMSLAGLLKDIQGTGTIEEVIRGMPYGPDTASELIADLDIDWEAFRYDKRKESEKGQRKPYVTRIKLTDHDIADQFKKDMRKAKGLLADGLPEDGDEAKGVVLATVLGFWLDNYKEPEADQADNE